MFRDHLYKKVRRIAEYENQNLKLHLEYMYAYGCMLPPNKKSAVVFVVLWTLLADQCSGAAAVVLRCYVVDPVMQWRSGSTLGSHVADPGPKLGEEPNKDLLIPSIRFQQGES